MYLIDLLNTLATKADVRLYTEEKIHWPDGNETARCLGNHYAETWRRALAKFPNPKAFTLAESPEYILVGGEPQWCIVIKAENQKQLELLDARGNVLYTDLM